MSAPSVAPPPRRGLPERAVRLVGSYGLACVILMLLLLVVLLGTLAQMSMSLYDVQQKYFGSLFFTVDLPGGIPLPLPGGALLLGALLVNLLVGGVIRMRLRLQSAGILVAHLGIVILLVGSAIEYARSDKGYVSLRLGQSGDTFYSHTDWELAVREDPGPLAREFVLPQADLERAQGGHRVERRHPALPFAILLEGYERNSVVVASREAQAVDGLALEARGSAREAEGNVPGAYVTLSPTDGSAPVRGIVWGFERVPWVVRVGGRRYEVDLRKQQWKVPFSLRLDRFVKADYPGTTMPKEFSSYVTKTENGVSEERHITMNEPLRHRGYTFYQSDYGPKEPGSRATPWSTFSVVRNPTDRVPLFACVVIALGLLLHFGIKLYFHLRREAASRLVRAEVRA